MLFVVGFQLEEVKHLDYRVAIYQDRLIDHDVDGVVLSRRLDKG